MAWCFRLSQLVALGSSGLDALDVPRAGWDPELLRALDRRGHLAPLQCAASAGRTVVGRSPGGRAIGRAAALGLLRFGQHPRRRYGSLHRPVR